MMHAEHDRENACLFFLNIYFFLILVKTEKVFIVNIGNNL